MLPRPSFVLCRVLRNKRGATAIEYTLLVTLLSVAALPAISGLGQRIQAFLGAVTTAMN